MHQLVVTPTGVQSSRRSAVVGVTGFEPATPTSRTLMANEPIDSRRPQRGGMIAMGQVQPGLPSARGPHKMGKYTPTNRAIAVVQNSADQTPTKGKLKPKPDRPKTRVTAAAVSSAYATVITGCTMSGRPV